MLKELFSYMKQYKKYAWISLACIAVECIFELVIPLIMADMVDVGIAKMCIRDRICTDGPVFEAREVEI